MLPPFADLDGFRHLLATAPGPDPQAADQARARQGQLTKPPGALGRLEEIAVWAAGWRADPRPRLTAPQVVIFAGNHGVAARGVSAFPAEVTAQMVANFQAGGAAINQLARAAGARLDVVALDLDHPTADFTQAPAMTGAELLAALTAGWQAVAPGTDLLVVGEMGIANTTSAAALCHALIGGTPRDWTGRGTGVDDAGLDRKAAVVAEGRLRHQTLTDPLDMLAALGGREIAAMAGAIAAARVHRIPVLLDGFIASAAALVLSRAAPGATAHCLAAHVSAEQAHPRLLQELGLTPLLSLGLRLGEGSGAALAIPLYRAALACHSEMATFAEAGVAAG
jgi:nicotinate-nucleotide--dimethylbenzimidazole phosphoribosyltransferase